MESLDSGLEGHEAPPSMDQWVGDYDYQLPQRGDIRSGTIVSIEPGEIVVDIGVKRDGIVPPRDLQMLGKEEVAKLEVGTQVPVYILKPEDADGNMIVSINIARKQQDWIHAEEMQRSEEIFEEGVIDYNKGGLLVSFGNLRGFVPASQLSDMPKGLSQERKMTRLKEYVGQALPLKVIEVDRLRRRLIMSQRAAQREWRERQKEQLLNSLAEGEVRRGVVSGLADFGAFVDLGGADGLIHVSELSWDRVSHPREVLEPGQEVDVYILRLDHERKRIGLSLKRLHPDPWSLVDEKYHVDQVVKGLVTNVVDFGAFARLEAGIEGLIHVSEMAEDDVVHPSTLLEPGQEVWARIISVDSQRKRIGLSLRDVSPPEELEPTELVEEVEPTEPPEPLELQEELEELEPAEPLEAAVSEEAAAEVEPAEPSEPPELQEELEELEPAEPLEAAVSEEAAAEVEPTEPPEPPELQEELQELEPAEPLEATVSEEAPAEVEPTEPSEAPDIQEELEELEPAEPLEATVSEEAPAEVEPTEPSEAPDVQEELQEVEPAEPLEATISEEAAAEVEPAEPSEPPDIQEELQEVEPAEPLEATVSEEAAAEVGPTEPSEAPDVHEELQEVEPAEPLEATVSEDAAAEVEPTEPPEAPDVQEEPEPAEPLEASDVQEAVAEVEPAESPEGFDIREGSEEPVVDQTLEHDSED